jgi:hypothetical protein
MRDTKIENHKDKEMKITSVCRHNKPQSNPHATCTRSAEISFRNFTFSVLVSLCKHVCMHACANVCSLCSIKHQKSCMARNNCHGAFNDASLPKIITLTLHQHSSRRHGDSTALLVGCASPSYCKRL